MCCAVIFPISEMILSRHDMGGMVNLSMKPPLMLTAACVGPMGKSAFGCVSSLCRSDWECHLCSGLALLTVDVVKCFAFCPSLTTTKLAGSCCNWIRHTINKISEKLFGKVRNSRKEVFVERVRQKYGGGIWIRQAW